MIPLRIVGIATLLSTFGLTGCAQMARMDEQMTAMQSMMQMMMDRMPPAPGKS